MNLGCNLRNGWDMDTQEHGPVLKTVVWDLGICVQLFALHEAGKVMLASQTEGFLKRLDVHHREFVSTHKSSLKMQVRKPDTLVRCAPM